MANAETTQLYAQSTFNGVPFSVEYTQTEIAKEIGVHKSTNSRELNKNITFARTKSEYMLIITVDNSSEFVYYEKSQMNLKLTFILHILIHLGNAGLMKILTVW